MKTEKELIKRIAELKKQRDFYQKTKNDLMGITITCTIHALEWVLNND